MKIMSILLIGLFITSICYAEKLVLYDKVNKEYVNDFQSSATKETLFNNATRSGRDKSEFEIKNISDSEYIDLEKEFNEPMRKQKEVEQENKKLQDKHKKQEILDRWGITEKDFEVLFNR